MNDNIILTKDQIKKHNETMIKNNHTIIDMNNYYDFLSKDQIKRFVSSYKITNDFFNKGKLIKQEEINIILDNRNINEIRDIKSIKAIVINRSNIRALPSDLAFYNKIDDDHFDRIQVSEIHFNSPVYIIHTSKDDKWYYVQCYCCRGWIKKEDVVLVDDYNYNFLTNSYPLIITEPLLNINNHILDMSVSIPFSHENNNSYESIIPISNNGLLSYERIQIPKESANIGYLDYTYDELYKQAFKYLGFPYGWGGLYNRVDCSSFIANVYRTFGFMFPRNTKDQNQVVGTKIINLENLSLEERKSILNLNYPSLLYIDGHVFLYLYPKNNKHYVINAYGANPMEVIESPLDDTGGRDYYMKLINLHKIN